MSNGEAQVISSKFNRYPVLSFLIKISRGLGYVQIGLTVILILIAWLGMVLSMFYGNIGANEYIVPFLVAGLISALAALGTFTGGQLIRVFLDLENSLREINGKLGSLSNQG